MRNTLTWKYVTIQCKKPVKTKSTDRKGGAPAQHSEWLPVCGLGISRLLGLLSPPAFWDAPARCAPDFQMKKNVCHTAKLGTRGSLYLSWWQGLDSALSNSQASLTEPPWPPTPSHTQATELGSHTSLPKSQYSLLSKIIRQVKAQLSLLISTPFPPIQLCSKEVTFC